MMMENMKSAKVYIGNIVKAITDFFFFTYIQPLISKSSKKELKEDSALEHIPIIHKCKNLSNQFEEIYNTSITGHARNVKCIIIKTLIKMFWKYFALQIIIGLISSILKISNAIFFQKLLTWFLKAKNDRDMVEGWKWALALIFLNFGIAITQARLYM